MVASQPCCSSKVWPSARSVASPTTRQPRSAEDHRASWRSSARLRRPWSLFLPALTSPTGPSDFPSDITSSAHHLSRMSRALPSYVLTAAGMISSDNESLGLFYAVWHGGQQRAIGEVGRVAQPIFRCGEVGGAGRRCQISQRRMRAQFVVIGNRNCGFCLPFDKPSGTPRRSPIRPDRGVMTLRIVCVKGRVEQLQPH